MNVITLSSLKGGVGKSSITIQLANCLGMAGKKVLVIDMDLNNSVSSYYLTDETKENIGSKNIADALSKTGNKLTDFTVPTQRRNVDLIASSLYLIDLRGLSERRLSQLLPTLQDNYDFVIVDCQPTYDNLVLNAYYAADWIITPINLSLFDYNTALFLRDKIATETDKIDNWFLQINGYNQNFSDAKTGKQKEYLSVFRSNFENLTPEAAWLPWTPAIKAVIDRNMFLSATNKENCICHPKLFNSLCNFTDLFLDESENLPELEAF